MILMTVVHTNQHQCTLVDEVVCTHVSSICFRRFLCKIQLESFTNLNANTILGKKKCAWLTKILSGQIPSRPQEMGVVRGGRWPCTLFHLNVQVPLGLAITVLDIPSASGRTPQISLWSANLQPLAIVAFIWISTSVEFPRSPLHSVQCKLRAVEHGLRGEILPEKYGGLKLFNVVIDLEQR